ncbi:unnamed protein product [Citrullus colocynthis]|uniref:Uncharacterized protein n=1 Tax=Citrullus colocynthis TaxID=252529 RepID=A0ABP0XSY5_9ROSI
MCDVYHIVEFPHPKLLCNIAYLTDKIKLSLLQSIRKREKKRKFALYSLLPSPHAGLSRPFLLFPLFFPNHSLLISLNPISRAAITPASQYNPLHRCSPDAALTRTISAAATARCTFSCAVSASRRTRCRSLSPARSRLSEQPELLISVVLAVGEVAPPLTFHIPKSRSD